MDLAASSYPVLSIFWSILEFFLWVLWIWILIWIFIDIFRSHDLSGWAKALWFLFVLFIPLIGVLVYLIVRGGSMHERAVSQARQQDAQFRQYVQQAAADLPASSADQLTKLADLRDRGVITAEEFEREKAKVLAA
jgi:Short C-terminal domain/Phospholipase_D-nuclease N-terminal